MSKYIVDIHGDIEGDYEIIKNYVEQQPEQRWIPCSERLPEMGSTVLMQYTGGWMFVATYAVTPKRKYWAVLEHDYALDEAIAWMPLPKPYKGDI